MLILIAVISLIMIVGIVVIFVYLSKDRKRKPGGAFEIEEDGVITIKITYEELKKKQDEVKKRKAKKKALKEMKLQGLKSPNSRFGDRQLSTILEESSYAETNEELTLCMETRSDMSSFNLNTRNEAAVSLLLSSKDKSF